MYYVSCTLQSKNEHTFPLFINANILPLNFLYYKTLSELMQGISTASAQLKYVIYLQQHPVSILTTHVLLLQKSFSRLKIQKNAFSRIGAKLWNEIPSSLRELLKKSFKLRIKNKLFSVLEDENSFFEV